MAPTAAAGLKLLGQAAVLGLLVLVSFQWGKNDCQKDQEKAERIISEDHTTTVATASDAATGRALGAQEKDFGNERIIEQLRRELAAAQGGDEQCLDSGYLDQLRDIQ